MLSNLHISFVLDLYSEFRIHEVTAKRAINLKANRRGNIDEVVITKY